MGLQSPPEPIRTATIVVLLADSGERYTQPASFHERDAASDRSTFRRKRRRLAGEDPKGKLTEWVPEIRDKIRNHVRRLIKVEDLAQLP